MQRQFLFAAMAAAVLFSGEASARDGVRFPNTATVSQSGVNNSAGLQQAGHNLTGAITQDGDNNTACLIQVGHNLDGAIVQTGDYNSLGVLQTKRGVRAIDPGICATGGLGMRAVALQMGTDAQPRAVTRQGRGKWTP